MNPNTRLRIALAALLCSISTTTVFGGVDNEDWIIFQDLGSGTECGVIHASNAEFVALFDSGEMVIVTGADTRFQNLVVTSDDQVLYLNPDTEEFEPAGRIEFLLDEENLPTIFWTTLVETMVEVDTFTGEPFDSGQLPSQRENTYCDACDLIETSPVCDDSGSGDGDGGNGDGDDFTPLPILCGAFSPATLVLLTLALPFAKMRRSRHR
jgi:hypothetical protein